MSIFQIQRSVQVRLHTSAIHGIIPLVNKQKQLRPEKTLALPYTSAYNLAPPLGG
jgi:hypothetical protein